MRELNEEEINKVGGGLSTAVVFDWSMLKNLKAQIDAQMDIVVSEMQRSMSRYGESDS